MGHCNDDGGQGETALVWDVQDLTHVGAMLTAKVQEDHQFGFF